MSERRSRRFRVDDLFTDTRPQAVGVQDLVNAKEIQLDRIEPDTDQPRREFDDESLAELAASITSEGVLQPIAVRYDAGRDLYIVIHGERRWRASKLAGLTTIPAIVRDIPEERILLQQLMENIVREDLNALDRAAALRALKDQMEDAPWDQVAEAVGIRRSRLFQLLGTEKLSAAFQSALREGRISEKQTRSVQRLSEEIQEELGQRLDTGDLDAGDIDLAARTVRQAESVAAARSLLDQLASNPSEISAEQQRLDQVERQTRALTRILHQFDTDISDSLRGELESLEHLLQRLLRRR